MSEQPHRPALVHDWLTGMRGGEKCLEVFCELFPEAPVYTLFGWPDTVSDVIGRHDIRVSPLQRLPGVREGYRNLLPLFPWAIEHFDLSAHDFVLSSSHAVAKGVRVSGQALHISYVHTPMRYVWDMFDQYFPADSTGRFKRMLIGLVARYIRRWDVRSSTRVHHFIANSGYVADRIRRHYGREADVIYPPVDVRRFTPSADHDGSYLVLSALVPYKRVDIAVRAFSELGLPLRVVGSGPELERLKSMAGDSVRFDGWLDDAEIETALRNCRALVFPGEEDFGIVPVEAMAAGKPVIAFGRGGATETVVEGLSGTFFPEQSPGALLDAVRRFERMEFDAGAIRRHAERFDRQTFTDRIANYVHDRWRSWTDRFAQNAGRSTD